MAWRSLKACLIAPLRQLQHAGALAEVETRTRPAVARLLSSASEAQPDAATQPPADAANPPAAGYGAAADQHEARQDQGLSRAGGDARGLASDDQGSRPHYLGSERRSGNLGGGNRRGGGGGGYGGGGEGRRSRQSQRSRNFRDQRDGRRQGEQGPAADGEDSRPLAKIRVDHAVRISGFGRLAMRRDVMRLLADVDIPTEEIRLEYDSETLNPKGFWANLATPEQQQRALAWNGAIMAGRPITVAPADPLAMRRAILSPLAMGSRGRYVLVSGIQDNATLEDIVRFFEGYDLMGNPVTMLKQADRKPFSRGHGRTAAGVLRALVRFTRTEEAHRAVRERQLGFLLNTSVTLRVMQ